MAIKRYKPTYKKCHQKNIKNLQLKNKIKKNNKKIKNTNKKIIT